MKSSEYWSKRFDAIEQVANTQSTKFVRSMKKQYMIAQKAIDEKIAYWYERLAVNNEMTVESAHKLLTENELKEFKWTLEEYIDYGMKNAIDQRFMKELENASAKVHIKKLEALKLESRYQIEKLLGNIQSDLDDMLYHVYEDSYYRTMFEIQKGCSVGFNVSALDSNLIDKVINKTWSADGAHYSDRIWTNKTKLVNTLNQEFSKMVLTRGNISDTTKVVAKTMSTSYSNAERLVYTEQAFLTTQAQYDSYNELDVDEYMVVVSLDDRTCSKCAQFDHEHYPLKDMEIGVNAPPFHPRCRCTTAPYVDTSKYTEALRASRDENGKTVYIPRNMNYNEWKQNYVV